MHSLFRLAAKRINFRRGVNHVMQMQNAALDRDGFIREFLSALEISFARQN